MSHSFSKKYFTEKFAKQSINAAYLNFELQNISDVSHLFKQNGICGLNVTIPYKQSVIPFLDELDPVAAEIGAVNTIRLKDGKTKGYNTDAYGFKQMIAPFFKSHHERAMILGTGGASKAVAHVLENLGCNVIYISRTPKEGDQFLYEEINDKMVLFNQLIVNCTPVGTYPDFDEMPALPVEYLTNEHLVIDLIYNPEKSKFLKMAETMGAVILNGRTMLEQQAEKSWEIWNE